MRLSIVFATVCAVAGLQSASAQVFKCQDADGKVSWAPCVKGDSKEQRIRITASPTTDPSASSANATLKAALDQGTAQALKAPTMLGGGLRKTPDAGLPTNALRKK